MYFEELPALKLSFKLAKSDWIKLLHKFIFNCDRSRQNGENLRKFDGFKLKIGDADFEAKLNCIREA